MFPNQLALPFSPKSLGIWGWMLRAGMHVQEGQRTGVTPTYCFITFIFFSVIINLKMSCLLPASLMVLNAMHCYFTALHPVPRSFCEGRTADISLTFSVSIQCGHIVDFQSIPDKQLSGIFSSFPVGFTSFWKRWHFCV